MGVLAEQGGSITLYKEFGAPHTGCIREFSCPPNKDPNLSAVNSHISNNAMEPVHPIPNRKSSVAALEKLVSVAEEMAVVRDGPSGTEDVTKPFSSGTPGLAPDSITPPMLSQQQPILDYIPFPFPPDTDFDANTAEALYTLSDPTWLDQPLFSPTTPTSKGLIFDWSACNDESMYPAYPSPPVTLDYYNVRPPHQLSTSLPDTGDNQSPLFGLLLPTVSVDSAKNSRVKPEATSTVKCGSLSGVGRWGLSSSSIENALLPNLSTTAVPEPAAIDGIMTPFSPLPPSPPQFLSLNQPVNWDCASTTTETSASTTLSAGPSVSNSFLGNSPRLMSLDEQVEEFVQNTFRNSPEELKNAWFTFLKRAISENEESGNFWLSPDNAGVWASLGEGNIGDLTRDFEGLDQQAIGDDLSLKQWSYSGLEKFEEDNFALSAAQDLELFGIDINDEIYQKQGLQQV